MQRWTVIKISICYSVIHSCRGVSKNFGRGLKDLLLAQQGQQGKKSILLSLWYLHAWFQTVNMIECFWIADVTLSYLDMTSSISVLSYHCSGSKVFIKMVLCLWKMKVIGVIIWCDIQQHIDVILSCLIMCQPEGNSVAGVAISNLKRFNVVPSKPVIEVSRRQRIRVWDNYWCTAKIPINKMNNIGSFKTHGSTYNVGPTFLQFTAVYSWNEHDSKTSTTCIFLTNDDYRPGTDHWYIKTDFCSVPYTV